MSPELEKLLEAFHEKRTCPPDEKSERAALFEKLLNDALARRPGASRNPFSKASRVAIRTSAAPDASPPRCRRVRSLKPACNQQRILNLLIEDGAVPTPPNTC